MAKKLIFTGLIFLASTFTLVEKHADKLSAAELQEKFGNKIIVKDAEPAKVGKPSIGIASWYNFRGGFFAASPFFKKGSALRVTNLDNGKSVDVIVNDFGPNKSAHPNRVIDLDKIAFERLAALKTGLIRVKVSRLLNSELKSSN